MKRLLAFAAGVLMLVSCSETFDATRLLQGGMIAAQAMSLSDEQVQAYVHQYITQLDAQSKVLPETNAYTKRLRALTKGLNSVDGVPLNFKVYQENQVNAFACADGSVRVYTGIMDVMTDNELLGVIGHEIGHVAMKHTKKEMRNSLLTSAALEGIASTSQTAPQGRGQEPLGHGDVFRKAAESGRRLRRTGFGRPETVLLPSGYGNPHPPDGRTRHGGRLQAAGEIVVRN